MHSCQSVYMNILKDFSYILKYMCQITVIDLIGGFLMTGFIGWNRNGIFKVHIFSNEIMIRSMMASTGG